MLNVIIVIATYQGWEGVDQLFCLNCDKGGGVPKYEAKTIQREPLDIIRLKRKLHSWILPLETQRIWILCKHKVIGTQLSLLIGQVPSNWALDIVLKNPWKSVS